MKRGPKPKGKVKLVWSPKFAYAVGLLTADGCLLNDGRHIDFTSKDIEQVETFKKCLGLKVKTGVKHSGIGNPYTRVQFGDVLFYKFLTEIGLSPAKSKIISAVYVPEEYFTDFLRGYFDGDGTSYSFYDSIFPKSFRFYISFMSASPTFIGWLRAQIQRHVGLKGYISRYSNSDYLQLKYSKYEAIVLARFMYQNKSTFYLKRKYLKILASLRIIGQRPGGEIGIHATFRS